MCFKILGILVFNLCFAENGGHAQVGHLEPKRKTHSVSESQALRWATELGDEPNPIARTQFQKKLSKIPVRQFAHMKNLKRALKPYVAHWIAQLDSDSFRERQLARSLLYRMGEEATLQLKNALKQNPSEEKKMLIERVLRLPAPPITADQLGQRLRREVLASPLRKELVELAHILRLAFKPGKEQLGQIDLRLRFGKGFVVDGLDRHQARKERQTLLQGLLSGIRMNGKKVQLHLRSGNEYVSVGNSWYRLHVTGEYLILSPVTRRFAVRYFHVPILSKNSTYSSENGRKIIRKNRQSTLQLNRRAIPVLRFPNGSIPATASVHARFDSPGYSVAPALVAPGALAPLVGQLRKDLEQWRTIPSWIGNRYRWNQPQRYNEKNKPIRE